MYELQNTSKLQGISEALLSLLWLHYRPTMEGATGLFVGN